MLTPVLTQEKNSESLTLFLLCWILVLLPMQQAKARSLSQIDDLSHIKSGSLVFRQQAQTGWQLMPGLNTRVKLQVNGMLLRARIEQEFQNNSQHWLNSTYVFPMAHQAAIDKLQIQVGQRIIKGKVQPRAVAQKTYQKAKSQGKKAALLQQHKADVFTTDVANIAPGETVKIQIEYQHLLAYQQGQFSLRFPLLAVPRYRAIQRPPAFSSDFAPASKSFNKPEYIAEFSQEIPANAVEINVELDAGLPIETINSLSHRIQVQQHNDSQYNISLEPGSLANRDFVLNWKTQSSTAPQSTEFVEYYRDQQYGMLMLMPPQGEQEDRGKLTREVLLVIDTSGSMAGASLRQAKQALSAALETLAEKDSFNLIEFNSQPRVVFNKAIVANQANKSLALAELEKLEASGGTEMAAALELAFAQETENNPLRQVIFITDGSVDNEEQLFHLIQNKRGNSRLYTVGIGSAPNSLFMQYAAQSGKGTFTYIASAEQAKNKILALFEQIQQPVLADIATSFPAGTEFYPKQIPDLYTGQPLLIFYKSPVAMQDIHLSGQLASNTWQQSLILGTGKEKAGIHKLWAKAKIRDLTLSYRNYAQQNYVKQQISHTAYQHQIISKYTSLVAVDEQSSRPDTQTAVDSNIVLPVSKGYGRLPQTATSAQLQQTIGLLLIVIALLLIHTRKTQDV